jgi:Domain of unknown function (DUF4192)
MRAVTTRTRRALQDAERRLLARVVTAGGIAPWRAAADQRLRMALDTFARRGRLSGRVAADLIVALVDEPTRDRWCRLVESRTGSDWGAFWLHLSSRSLRSYRTEPLFLLAWSAWRLGDVRLARAAADDVLAQDPWHRAAAILLALLWLDVEPGRMPSVAGQPATSQAAS